MSQLEKKTQELKYNFDALLKSVSEEDIQDVPMRINRLHRQLSELSQEIEKTIINQIKDL